MKKLLKLLVMLCFNIKSFIIFFVELKNQSVYNIGLSGLLSDLDTEWSFFMKNDIGNQELDSERLGFNRIDIDEYIDAHSDEVNQEVLNSGNNDELKEVTEYNESGEAAMINETATVEGDSKSDTSDDITGADQEKEEKTSKIKRAYKKIHAFNTRSQNFLYKKLHIILDHPVLASIVMSFIMLLFIETMSRKANFIEAIKFMFKSPLRFALNWLIVMVPFMLAIAVKRKLLIYALSIVMWAIVGITDYHLLQHRTTPFVGTDIDLNPDELAIAVMYLKVWQVALIVIGILAALLVIVMLLFVCPKTKTVFGRIKSLGAFCLYFLATYGMIVIGINTNILTMKFGNLAISYHDYGIAYCLCMTIFDTGISKPEDYSKAKVKETVAGTKKPTATTKPSADPDGKDHEKTTEDEVKKPNIIFIQLESYVDPTTLKGISYSVNPSLYFQTLKRKYSSGYITVPTIVAGTCNTEFEVITGMSLEYFGPGEYPYKTKVNKEVCESMAFDIKQAGYAAHAIHNNKATFYGRNVVFSNLGFDTFTSIETMDNVKKTPNGWAEDSVLINSILDCMKSTEEKDLIYTVSVQCHGTYNVDPDSYDHEVEVEGISDEDLLNQYTYYVNEVYQEDDFLVDLTKALENFDEDVVLVMYGDHIPGLGFTNDSFTDPNRNIYQTEYVIWDNMGLKKNDVDNIYAYQMAAYIFDMFDIHVGTIFNYHQTNHEDKNGQYMSGLKLLMYDMLYGEKYVYEGVTPFVKTDMKFGVKDIIINDVIFRNEGDTVDELFGPENEDDPDGDFNDPQSTGEPYPTTAPPALSDDSYLFIEGENFNNYSKVFINGSKRSTTYLSKNLLQVKMSDEPEEGTVIVVKQINSAGDSLRESEEYIYEQ